MSLVRYLPLVAVSALVGVVFVGCAATADDEAGSEASEVKSSAPVTGKQEVGKVFKVTADALRLRRDPTLAAGNVLETLKQGTLVKIAKAEPTGMFYNVEVVTSKKKGWVDGSYLIAEKTAPAPAGSCTTLTTCCAALKTAGLSDTECKSVAAAGNNATCASTHQRHTTAGDCVAPATNASATEPTSGACATLSTCCADLKKAGFSDAECRSVASAGNSATCTSTHQRHANAGECISPANDGGAPAAGSCSTLSTCCSDLKKAGLDDTECRRVVSSGDNASCASTHQRHASFGECVTP